MIRPLLSTHRPVPSRRAPAAVGGLVVLLALPLFLVAGWPISGWAIALVLWVAGEVLAYAVTRLPLGLDNLASSGFVAIAMSFRVIAVMIVLIAVTAADKPVGVAAALTYIAAYSVELAVSLVSYFGGGT